MDNNNNSYLLLNISISIYRSNYESISLKKMVCLFLSAIRVGEFKEFGTLLGNKVLIGCQSKFKVKYFRQFTKLTILLFC